MDEPQTVCYQEAVTYSKLSKMEHRVPHGNSTSHTSVDTEILPQSGYTILAVIMGALSVAGIIFNVVVIVVTVRHRQLRHPLSYALVNLAICDLGCAVFGGLLTTVASAMGYFSLGRVGCVLEGFAMAFFGKSIDSMLFYVQKFEVKCHVKVGIILICTVVEEPVRSFTYGSAAM